MIRDDDEYEIVLQEFQRLNEDLQKQREHCALLRQELLNAHPTLLATDGEITKRVMNPLLATALRLERELLTYARLKAGDVEEVRNCKTVGELLVALRLVLGCSVEQLAFVLDLPTEVVETEEAQGWPTVPLDRLRDLFYALGYELRLGLRPRDTMTTRYVYDVGPGIQELRSSFHDHLAHHLNKTK